MKRSAIIGALGVASVSVALAGGWWYAQREAAKEVRRAMIDADLVGRVAYGGVSYNPLTGAVSVRDVRPVGDEIPFAIRADAVELIDWHREDDLVTRAHIKVVNLRMDVLEAARNEFQKNPAVFAVSFRDPPAKILGHPLQALAVLGYRDLIANAEVDYRYDHAEALVKLAVSLDSVRMGGLKLDFGLAGVKPKLIRALAEIANQASAENPLAALGGLGVLSGQKKDVEQISLAAFGLSYEDAGLAHRLKQYHDVHVLRLPSEPSELELSEAQVDEAVAIAVKHGVPKDKARSSVEAVANFSKQPQRLRLQTKIDEPLRLSRLAEDANNPKGISRLVLLTDAEVTN